MTKATDVLDLYLKFMAGQRLTKLEIKDILEHKSERTVQRYIADLNTFFENKNKNKKIVMNQTDKKYELIRNDHVSFDKEQLLAILKILIASRGLSKEEIQHVITRLKQQVSDENYKIIEKAIKSEMIHYVHMNHGEPLFHKLWELNELIQQEKTIEFEYFNAMNRGRIHNIKPMYITYSELYFYLVGINEKEQVIIFRVDRIQEFKVTDDKFKVTEDKFKVPHSPYIREGELKKRIYFMYGGEWKKVVFEFNGGIIESVLDRFPTAKLIKKDYIHNRFTVEIEVIGDGILMWFLSQGARVKVLSPIDLKQKHINEVEKIIENYR
ncbi:helix-turn-helix transcriptional regulator [Staphylococcus hominis]|uniref:helix-turn-helix transcriptional regulator n=1 Tax=Staphylococcus hominis TaxID=1290 RepID=UPI0011A798AD|nr:WYL domain-containing protein [Staphylococcus hominis]